MMQTMIQSRFLAPVLLLLTTPLFAGQLYRFPDENGVPTISRSLPPSVAQNGYDILDDKSLRLIERIEPALTPEQIIAEESELNAQILAEKEAQKTRTKTEQATKRAKQKQAVYEQNLRASYSSEQELLTDRDNNITRRTVKIQELTAKIPKLKQSLAKQQQQAAEQELRGRGLSPNLQKRLTASQQAIEINANTISSLEQEIIQLTEQYAADLIRLRELLQAATSSN